MQLTSLIQRMEGCDLATVSRIARGTFLALASLFIVNVGVAEAATPVAVESITWNGNYYVFVVSNTGGLSGSMEGLLPMRGLYGGGGMDDLYQNNTQTALKCKSTLVSYPSYASATSSGTVNIDDVLHNGSYNGPFASNSGNVVCSSPGVYYAQFNAPGSINTYYFQYYWNGSAIEEINPDWWIDQNAVGDTYDTRLLAATFSASSTVTGVVSYYIDTADFVGQFDRPDVILVNISSLDTTQFESIQKLTLPLTIGYATTTLTGNQVIPDGNYSAMVNFWNMATQSFVLNRSNLTINFTVSGGAVTSQTVVDNNDALFPTPTDVYEECGLTALSGCISNSIRFLFYPSSASVDTFMESYTQLQTKLPFVYAYQASGLLSGMFTGTAGVIPTISVTTDIGEIVFITQSQVAALPFVSLMRSLIAAGLWIMLFVILYRKTLTIHDKTTV